MHGIKAVGTLHEPQSAAGILPAEESEERSADATSAAHCWRIDDLPRNWILLQLSSE